MFFEVKEGDAQYERMLLRNKAGDVIATLTRNESIEDNRYWPWLCACIAGIPKSHEDKEATSKWIRELRTYGVKDGIEIEELGAKVEDLEEELALLKKTTQDWIDPSYVNRGDVFSITIKTVGNPDMQQYTPITEPKLFEAQAFDVIKMQVREYQMNENIGMGNWTNPTLYKGGKALGYMSYNGRVWKFNSEEEEIDV